MYGPWFVATHLEDFWGASAIVRQHVLLTLAITWPQEVIASLRGFRWRLRWMALLAILAPADTNCALRHLNDCRMLDT